MKLFWCQGIFSLILISKMGVKNEIFRIITKDHAADSKEGPKKGILEPPRVPPESLGVK